MFIFHLTSFSYRHFYFTSMHCRTFSNCQIVPFGEAMPSGKYLLNSFIFLVLIFPNSIFLKTSVEYTHLFDEINLTLCLTSVKFYVWCQIIGFYLKMLHCKLFFFQEINGKLLTLNLWILFFSCTNLYFNDFFLSILMIFF